MVFRTFGIVGWGGEPVMSLVGLLGPLKCFNLFNSLTTTVAEPIRREHSPGGGV
jgi:hypothetical protein